MRERREKNYLINVDFAVITVNTADKMNRMQRRYEWKKGKPTLFPKNKPLKYCAVC